MNVLSLFDGISCGRVALNEIGIKVDNYYASEVKNFAMRCSKDNHDDIIHIGDVTKISYKDGILKTENGDFNVGNIDLLIGGSPCQDFSILNTKRLGLDGEKSKAVVVVESEKSVMQAFSFGYRNIVALGSSNFSERQLNLLLELGVTTVVYALDEGSDFIKVSNVLDRFKGYRDKVGFCYIKSTLS